MFNIQQRYPSDTLKPLSNSQNSSLTNSSLTDEQKQRKLYEYEKYMRKLDLIGDKKYDTCHLELSIKNGDITLNKIYITPDKDGNAIINIPDFVDTVDCDDYPIIKYPMSIDYMFKTIKVQGKLGKIDTKHRLILRSLKNLAIYLDLSEADFDGYTTLHKVFRDAYFLQSITFGYNGKTITNIDSIFSNCRELTKIDFNNLDLSSVESLDSVFNNCTQLSVVDLSVFSKSPIKSMKQTFRYCRSLKKIDLSQMNCESLENLEHAFSESGIEKFQFAGIKFKNPLYLGDTFNGCEHLKKVDLGNIYIKFAHMLFLGCKNLEEIDFNEVHTELCTNFDRFFDGCESLRALDTQRLDFRSASQLQGMFQAQGLYSIELKNRDFRQVDPTIRTMFDPYYYKAPIIRTIYPTDLERIDKEFSSYQTYDKQKNDIAFNGLFAYCVKLKSLDLSGCIFPPMKEFLYWFECTFIEQINLENCDFRYCDFEDTEQFTERKDLAGFLKILRDDGNDCKDLGCTIKHLYIKGIKADPQKLERFLDKVKQYNPGIEIHT